MTVSKLPPDWRPNPALAQAVQSALQAMAVHWPRALAIVGSGSEASAGYVADYARAVFGQDLAAIAEAGRRWIAENASPPRPVEFGDLTRRIAFELRPSTPSASSPVPPLEGARFHSLAEHRSRRARSFVRDWGEVAHVWAVCYEDAETDEAREDVRFGRVSLSIFDVAIEAVLAGRRARGGGAVAVSERLDR